MDYMEKITDLGPEKDLKDQAANLVEEDKLDDATPWPTRWRPSTSRSPAGGPGQGSREGADPVYDGVLHDGEGKPGTAGRTPPSPSPPWGSS